MSDNRDMGVEFGDLTDDLEDEDYPLSRETLLEKYGDRELEHASGATTVREILPEEGQEEFEEPEMVHQTLLNMVGTEAVGRDRYSDRGGTNPTQNEAVEDQNEDETV